MTRGPIDIGKRVRCTSSGWEGVVVGHLPGTLVIRIDVIAWKGALRYVPGHSLAHRSGHPSVENGLTVVESYSVEIKEAAEQ